MVSPQDLPPEIQDRLAHYQLDILSEKHERFGWHWLLERAQFITVDGVRVLLPFMGDTANRVVVLRSLRDSAGDLLTLFLRWTSAERGDALATPLDPLGEPLDMLAVCVRVPEDDFFITIVYHEVFRLDDLPSAELEAAWGRPLVHR